MSQSWTAEFDLARQRGAVLAEDASTVFELQRVDVQLLVEALSVAGGVLGQQWLEDP